MKKTLLLAGITGLFALNANAQYCNCQQKSQPLYNTQPTYQSQQSQTYNNQNQTLPWNIALLSVLILFILY